MVNKQLVDYIKIQESRGSSSQQLSNYLVQQGYNLSEVKEAIDYVNKPQTSSSSNKKFIFIIIFIVIVITIVIASFWLFTKPICNTNQECNDNNDNTLDMCASHSTRDSKCINAQQIELSSIEKEIAINQQNSVSFKVNDEYHLIDVKKITDNSVTIVVYSEPTEVTLYIGQSKEIDANNDGLNDFYIKLASISNGKPIFQIKSIGGCVYNLECKDNDTSTKDTCSNYKCSHAKINLDVTGINLECSNVFSGQHGKINVIFLANKFDKENLGVFDEIVPIHAGLAQQKEGGFLTLEPFKSYKEYFNIYKIRNTNNWGCDSGETPFIGCVLDDLEFMAKDFCGLDKVDLFITLTNGYISNGLGYHGNAFTNDYSISPRAFFTVHEIGHSFANLGDGHRILNIYYSDSTAKQIANESANIDIRGCPKWCSGDLNTSHECFKYFKQFESCISPFLTNSENNWQSIKNCEEEVNIAYLNEYGVQTDEFGLQHNPTIERCNLGTSCISNTGCYFGGAGLNVWRSEDVDIMTISIISGGKVYGYYYGSISEKAIEDKIKALIF